VDSEQLSTALWPDRPFNPQVVSQRLAEARALLDAAISKGPVHHLDPSVGSDWQRFQSLAAGDLEDKRAALALLRGRPFDGLPRRCEWIYAENHVAEICSAGADLACELAEQDIANGDYAAAEAAAVAGLKVNPYEEPLYLLAAGAAAEAGRPGMVQIYSQQLHAVIEDEADPSDRVHPDTDRELDRLLTQAKRRAARQAG
jgi:DNA-binding SARP family transcriptional activator